MIHCMVVVRRYQALLHLLQAYFHEFVAYTIPRVRLILRIRVAGIRRHVTS